MVPFSGRKVNRLAGIWKRLAQRKGRGVPICSVVIPAAGSSSRMEGIDKILEPLGNSRCWCAPFRCSRAAIWSMR